MAAFTNFSSSSWIVNQDLFNAYLRAGLADKRKISCFIREECVEKVYNGFNQFFHWEKKLHISEERSVLTFTYMGPSGLIKPNIDVVQELISSKLGKGLIECINYPENSNFLTLVMCKPEAALAARQVVASWSGAQACFVELKAHNVYGVKILWTPVFYKIEGVRETLRTWCEEVKIENEDIVFSNGEHIKTNKITGHITLREGLSLSQVPHVVKLVDSDNQYVLILIRERPPLCLKCRMEGHIRKSCVFKKCLRCRQLHDLRESCPIKTFASVTRGDKIPWLVDKNSRMEEFDELKNVDGHERKDQNSIKTVVFKRDKIQNSHPDSIKSKNTSDRSKNGNTESLTTENECSNGQESTCTLTENDGFELVTKKVVRRNMADGKELGYKQKVWSVKDITSEKEGIYRALEDEMDWGQEMDRVEVDSKVNNKDISCLDVLEVAESSNRSKYLREDVKTGSKKKKREQNDGESLEKKKKLTDNIFEKVESPDASFIIKFRPEDECEMLKEESMGVMTKISSKPFKNTEVDTSEITSDGMEHSDTDKSENDDSYSDLDICLEGFKIDATVDIVGKFLKGLKPVELWTNFEHDQPDGIFGARFGTKEEAKAALSLHRRLHNGRRISVTYFKK